MQRKIMPPVADAPRIPYACHHLTLLCQPAQLHGINKRMDVIHSEDAAMTPLKTNDDQIRVKAQTVTADGIEPPIEVRLKDASTNFMNRLSSLDGIVRAALVTYNGKYMS